MRQAARALTAAFALTLAAGTASAQEKAAFGEGGSGLLYMPAGKGPFPAVIVIHEWWGLDEWVKSQAAKLRDAGYMALAVDLYRGKVTKDKDEAHQLMMGLAPDRALADLKAAAAFLRARKDVKAEKVGAIGWCMGGRYAFLLATEDPKLAAAVPYYGAPPTDDAAIARIQAPILGNFGAEDKGPSPDAVRAFEAAAKKRGKSVDVKIYEGAGHAFANENNPFGGYRKEAAADAWARTLAFFAKHLEG